MTHEEILKKYQVMTYVHDHNVQVNWVKVSDALKAMAEATEFWVKQWNYAQEQLAEKDKEIAELKGEIINALRKETGYSRERCVDALVKSGYNLQMAKDIATKNHPKF